MLSLPAHSIHKAQTLGPLKIFFFWDKWTTNNHPSLPTIVYQVDSIFTKDYVKAAITGNAMKVSEMNGVLYIEQEDAFWTRVPSFCSKRSFLLNELFKNKNDQSFTLRSKKNIAIKETAPCSVSYCFNWCNNNVTRSCCNQWRWYVSVH
jgi:hypothetical protein